MFTSLVSPARLSLTLVQRLGKVKLSGEFPPLPILLISGAIFFLVFAIVLSLEALVLRYLWNWLVPVILQLPKITFFQAMGLHLLCGHLFKGNPTNIDAEKAINIFKGKNSEPPN